MEDETRILVSRAKPTTPSTGGNACLVHIYPTGPGMGTRYPLGQRPLMIGREETCQIHVADESVSRKHACVQPDGDGYLVVDLDSTNGTFVNQQRIQAVRLNDGDYIHVGNAIYRYLAGGNVEAAYHEEIYRLTIIDALTEIHNKRYLMDFLTRELACAARYRRPLSLMLFDLDHFKAINDRLGHLCGDFTLRELASVVKGLVRKEDLFARYGGEEFALVMPETTHPGGVQLAERIRATIEKHRFHYEGHVFPVTISAGVASITGDEWLTTTELIHQADQKLYQAKHDGRNRVVS
jgi:diguanylate cyclase (GGDEF)-like protein